MGLINYFIQKYIIRNLILPSIVASINRRLVSLSNVRLRIMIKLNLRRVKGKVDANIEEETYVQYMSYMYNTVQNSIHGYSLTHPRPYIQ